MKADEKTITVTAPEAREKFKEWVERGDAIAVFQNADLSHRNLGHRVFLPLDPEEQGKVEVGSTRAPDGLHGLGWRYLLERVTTDLSIFEFDEYDQVGEIIAYEQGNLDDERTLRLFGRLVASGLAWSFQGHYGRTAAGMIDAGLIDRGTGEVQWDRFEELRQDIEDGGGL
jgi:hypothetical protein